MRLIIVRDEEWTIVWRVLARLSFLTLCHLLFGRAREACPNDSLAHKLCCVGLSSNFSCTSSTSVPWRLVHDTAQSPVRAFRIIYNRSTTRSIPLQETLNVPCELQVTYVLTAPV